MNFWNKQAYDIAKRITSDRDIHRDLVSFIYILLHDRNIVSISLPATFARYAYQQYNWKNSEFNKLYVSFDRDISEINIEKICEDYEESHYGNMLDEYFEQKSSNDAEFFCKEIAKLVFQSMSYREIQALTGIKISTITKTMQKFKYDFRNFCDNRDRPVLVDATNARH
jgi:Trp operon repressor